MLKEKTEMPFQTPWVWLQVPVTLWARTDQGVLVRVTHGGVAIDRSPLLPRSSSSSSYC